jgi:uncharacterized membrane protein
MARESLCLPCETMHTSHMKTVLLALGIFALLVGLLWIGQGTGTIDWPRSSFMIRQTQWAYYGAALALVGLILIWRARR